MLATAVIVFRETLEAALVESIVVARGGRDGGRGAALT
jgi:high-affinity Fe2+/Pb2+ permease